MCGGVCCQTFSFVLFSLLSRPRARELAPVLSTFLGLETSTLNVRNNNNNNNKCRPHHRKLYTAHLKREEGYHVHLLHTYVSYDSNFTSILYNNSPISRVTRRTSLYTSGGMSTTVPNCPSRSTGAYATHGAASRSAPSSCTTDRALPSSSKSGC